MLGRFLYDFSALFASLAIGIIGLLIEIARNRISRAFKGCQEDFGHQMSRQVHRMRCSGRLALLIKR